MRLEPLLNELCLGLQHWLRLWQLESACIQVVKIEIAQIKSATAREGVFAWAADTEITLKIAPLEITSELGSRRSWLRSINKRLDLR